MSDEIKGEEMGHLIQIDEARIQDNLGEMVRGTVEEALNAVLGVEMGQGIMDAARQIRLCGTATTTVRYTPKRAKSI